MELHFLSACSMLSEAARKQGSCSRELLAWLLSGCVVCILLLQTPVTASADPFELSGTRHTDHRDTPKVDFPDTAASQVKSADEYLLAQSARYKLPADLSNLEIVSVRKGLLGTYTRFRQILNGLPVEGAEIVVSQRKADGSVFQVCNNTYPVEAPVEIKKNIVDKDTAVQKAWDHLRVYGKLRKAPKADLIYTPEKAGFKLVYKTLITVDGPFGYWEHKIDADSGDVISVRRHEISEKYGRNDVPDFAAYKGPTTSLQAELSRLEAEANAAQADIKTRSAPSAKTTVDGSALVFDPDPRTTLNNASLVNASPASSFDAAYVSRVLKDISFDAGVYYLEGPWVYITNIAAELPPVPVSTTTTGSWTNKRGFNAFNDVMCYFHIDQNQRYLQSLGYTADTGIQEAPIAIDSHGLSGADNSWYVPSENYIAFGHGGVDDNEDADVILHEYGHAMVEDIIPGWDYGDSGAIGEGFGDYWGASYSWTCVNGSVFNPEWAFSWDGHSADTWTGRFLDKTNFTYDSSHTYVAHETIGGKANYSDQLWGTPLYQSFRDLISLGRPRTEMDTIMVESYFGVANGPTMRDMATAIVKAATELYPSGQHAWTYYVRFTNQLILVAYPLPDPTLTYPAGGETFATGSTINVQWNRNNAAAAAAARLEYRSEPSVVYFYDQVESGANGWAESKSGGSSWLITASSNHSPTMSWFASNDAAIADQYLTRSSISVSNGAVLSFWHFYNLESTYDGAVVEISLNGSTWTDLGTNASQNGYNATISSAFNNPIKGRKAFSGSSGGFVETKIPLTSYEGQTVSIRFREADDSADKAVGWWVDDIKIQVEPPWTYVTTTGTNASDYLWTLPAVVSTNCAVRVKLTATNYTDSSWSTSPAFTIEPGVVHRKLVVSSSFGGAVPATGTNALPSGTNVVCTVTNSPVVLAGGTTQRVCTGWTGTGNVPASGSGTNVSFVLDSDSTIAWIWSTNHWLNTSTNGSGTVLPAASWRGAGSDVVVTGAPSTYWNFSRWSGSGTGAIVAGSINTATATVRMTTPVAIVGEFAAILATNGTPQWWLASYGLTNAGFDAEAMRDSDGDGMAAWREWWSGTDPTVATSVFKVVQTSYAGTNVVLTWNAVSGKYYRVYSLTNMVATNWVAVSSLITNSGTASREFTNGWSGTNRFYKISVR